MEMYYSIFTNHLERLWHIILTAIFLYSNSIYYCREVESGYVYIYRHMFSITFIVSQSSPSLSAEYPSASFKCGHFRGPLSRSCARGQRAVSERVPSPPDTLSISVQQWGIHIDALSVAVYRHVSTLWEQQITLPSHCVAYNEVSYFLQRTISQTGLREEKSESVKEIEGEQSTRQRRVVE